MNSMKPEVNEKCGDLIKVLQREREREKNRKEKKFFFLGEFVPKVLVKVFLT